MKICMFVTNPIGHDARVKNEAYHLVKAGHQVTVIGEPAADTTTRENWRGVRFLRLGRLGHSLDPLYKLYLFPLISRRPGTATTSSAPVREPGMGPLDLIWYAGHGASTLRRAVPWVTAGLGTGAQVFHAHDLDTLAYAWACAMLSGGRFVYDSHELYLDWKRTIGASRGSIRWFGWIERALIGDASLVVTVGDGIADRLKTMYGIPRPMVVRNCDRLRQPGAGSDRLRRLYGGAGGSPIVLYQGGFSPFRGLEEIILAADEVSEADFVFLGPESSYRTQLETLVSDRGSSNVHFLSAVPQDDLWEYTRGADIGVVMTQPAGLQFDLAESNKLYQYMAAGIPIVASSITSHTRIAEETGALVLADPHEPGSIAGAVKGLLSQRGRAHEMGRSGRKWAEKKYNSDHEMGRLVKAYDALQAVD